MTYRIGYYIAGKRWAGCTIYRLGHGDIYLSSWRYAALLPSYLGLSLAYIRPSYIEINTNRENRGYQLNMGSAEMTILCINLFIVRYSLQQLFKSLLLDDIYKVIPAGICRYVITQH